MDLQHTSRPDNARGAIWIVAAAVTYSSLMALVKLLGTGYSSAMQNFVSQCVGLVALSPFILRRPRTVLALKRPALMIFRCGAVSLSIMLSYNSFHSLGLAEANALSFTRALFLVPLAALILGEGLDGHKLAATIMGFCGVIIVLSPGTSQSLPLWPALQGLLAAFLTSCAVISIKSMSKDHGNLTLLSWSSLLGILFTAPFAALDWHLPTGMDAVLMAAMGVLALVTQGCYIRGMTLGEAGFMAPLDYLRLPFIALLGYAMFGDLPLPSTYAGAAVIIGTALYVTLHGRRRDFAKLIERE